MQTYKPDKWVVLKIKNKGGVIYKVLAGWYGGYAGGDSWKVNSGITSYTESKEYYDFVGVTGSIYRCYKGSEGISGLMGVILAGFQKQIGATNIKPITIRTFKRNYEKS